MKKIVFLALLALAVVIPAHAKSNSDQAVVDVPLEAVDSIRLTGRFQSWRALDRDTLIVWVTGQRPYLIELSRPSHELRFAHAIGVTRTGWSVHSGFDSIIVEGIRYPIRQIYRLTPEDAKTLQTITMR